MLIEQKDSKGSLLIHCTTHKIALLVISNTFAYCLNDKIRAAAIVILNYRQSVAEGRGSEMLVLLEELCPLIEELDLPVRTLGTGVCQCLGLRCSEIGGECQETFSPYVC